MLQVEIEALNAEVAQAAVGCAFLKALSYYLAGVLLQFAYSR